MKLWILVTFLDQKVRQSFLQIQDRKKMFWTSHSTWVPEQERIQKAHRLADLQEKFRETSVEDEVALRW